jgi:hypothetical protein
MGERHPHSSESVLLTSIQRRCPSHVEWGRKRFISVYFVGLGVRSPESLKFRSLLIVIKSRSHVGSLCIRSKSIISNSQNIYLQPID